MNGLPYVGPDGRVVVLPPGQMPPPGYRATGPLAEAFKAPQGAPQAPMQPQPASNPQQPAGGPPGAPTAPSGPPSDNLGALGPQNDDSSAWFAAAAAAAQNMNNPMAALAAGLSTLNSTMSEREQARRLIKRQDAMDKLQARRVDIEQQQVDAQGRRWEAEGPEREARAKLLTSQAAEVAQRMNQPQFLNLGDGYTRQVNPDGSTTILDAPADMKAMARQKLSMDRARLSLAEGPKWLKGEVFYGRDGKTYQSWNNGRSGETEYVDTETAKRFTAVPGGLLRPQDTGAPTLGKLGAEDEVEGYKQAQQNIGRITNYDRMISLVGSSGVGAGVGAEARRQLGEFLGQDIGSMNLADKQVQEALIKQMEIEAAAQFKGQGGITNDERAILRASIARLDNDPSAFVDIVNVFKGRAQKQVDMMRKWDGLSAEERAGVPFTKFSFRHYNGAASAPAAKAGDTAQRPTVSPGAYKTKDGFSYTVE